MFLQWTGTVPIKYALRCIWCTKLTQKQFNNSETYNRQWGYIELSSVYSFCEAENKIHIYTL